MLGGSADKPNVLGYRRDIDGLRALAVVPVVLFHAGADWLPGGFVGVDIFFVISGYLITSLIVQQMFEERFSFLGFYERRIRRIIPALLLMLVVTVTTFQIIALPDQSLGASKSAIAALLSVSNIYFWRESGYFSPASEFMPLLHTWSLGVEEQFYIVFPIVILLVYKLRFSLKWSISLGTLAAFAICIYLSITKPSVAYYLLPARAWELGIGAVLAVRAVPPLKGALLRELVTIAGIALILVSLIYIRSDMIFPGWIAMLPCLGAAAVIYSGGQSWTAKYILGARPLVGIGLISYSLYLWHWPLLTTARIRSASIHLDVSLAMSTILASFVIAYLSWRYVEQPFRDRETVSSQRMAGLLATGVITLAIISTASISTSGFPHRLDENVRRMLSASRDIDPLRDKCVGIDQRSNCRFGNPTQPIKYAIIGDSHAAALRPAVEASGIMGDAAGTLYWVGACPFLSGASIQNKEESNVCTSFKSGLWSAIEDHKELTTVILAGRWAYAMTGILPESGGAYRAWLVDSETTSVSEAENKRVFARSLARTIDQLKARGLKIIVMGAIPEPAVDVPNTTALARLAGIDHPRTVYPAPKQRAADTDEVIVEILSRTPDIIFLPIWPAFCDEQACRIQQDGLPLYSDDDHVTYSAAIATVAPEIQNQFSRLMGATGTNSAKSTP